jgi:TolB protein
MKSSRLKPLPQKEGRTDADVKAATAGATFSFETPFTQTLPPFSFPGHGLPMKASPRLFAAFAAIFVLLLPLAALSQERGLEIDIVGGNASALPIAVVPMPNQGGGAAPETDVA